MSNVTNIKDKKDFLRFCILCKHHWHGRNEKCPICSSTNTIRDEVHIIPETHQCFACRCENVHFKIARHPAGRYYFKCARCGMTHTPKELGISK